MPIQASKIIENQTPLSPEEEKKKIEEELLKLNLLMDLQGAPRLPSALTPAFVNFSKEQAAIEAIRQSDPTNFQNIAASELDLSNSYYASVRIQSGQSFLWSLIASGVGLVFFIISVVFLIFELGKVSYFGAAVSAVGGAFVEVYAGLIQWQGRQTAKQAKDCRNDLNRIQRFIIANSACEGLKDEEKQKKRAEIISKLVE